MMVPYFCYYFFILFIINFNKIEAYIGCTSTCCALKQQQMYSIQMVNNNCCGCCRCNPFRQCSCCNGCCNNNNNALMFSSSQSCSTINNYQNYYNYPLPTYLINNQNIQPIPYENIYGTNNIGQKQQNYNNLLDNFNKINIGSYPVGGGGAIPIQIPPTVYIIGSLFLIKR
ncbi:hypothetical protein Mgra_00010091 [Meloidogyne graminicola]|uniref:Uncharacterized protein n=1 Tax=Meloidogyne graminicola TaxID=189291 RepID=A0A8S9ZA89_9BILA|nr:hypothetical protein Mgra_00010091 [Meloidogyne graminicola]